MVSSVAYCSYSFGGAEKRIRKTCSEIIPGMTVASLRSFADDHGLNPPHTNSGIVFLAETKSFGRWACKVELEKGMVKGSEYNFAD